MCVGGEKGKVLSQTRIEKEANPNKPKQSAWASGFLLALFSPPHELQYLKDNWFESTEKPKNEKSWRHLRALLNKKSIDRVALIHELRACGASVKERDRNGDTALMLAAQAQDADCVELLLPLSDVGAKNNRGETALMHAAGAGIAVMKLLLPRSDPKSVSRNGRSALMFAVGATNLECVNALLPVSDVLAMNNKGADAFEMALSIAEFGDNFADVENGDWMVVEKLASFVEIERLRESIARFAEDALPIANALVERHDLAVVVTSSQRGAGENINSTENPSERAEKFARRAIKRL